MQPQLTFIKKKIVNSKLLLDLLHIIIIIPARKLIATNRTRVVTPKPLKDIVLVKDMGAGHDPKLCASCNVLLIMVGQRLEADGIVIFN